MWPGSAEQLGGPSCSCHEPKGEQPPQEGGWASACVHGCASAGDEGCGHESFLQMVM